MTVFANGLEVACKAQGNKVLAAFPDVCFTPPQTPATPPGVPVPYPSFGVDSDTDNGTSTVKIGGQTITQKNKSYYTKTTGTEAGCAPKKNVITSVNRGKEYAHAWSGNVKCDGEPISRFSDLCTNDHASPGPGSGPQAKAGKGGKGKGTTIRCMVGKYEDIVAKCSEKGGEAHHIVPDMVYRLTARKAPVAKQVRVPGAPTEGEGIAICLTTEQHDSAHNSANTGMLKQAGAPNLPGSPTGTAKIGDVAVVSLKALKAVEPKISAACLKRAKKKVDNQTRKIRKKLGRTTNRPPGRRTVAFKAINRA